MRTFLLALLLTGGALAEPRGPVLIMLPDDFMGPEYTLPRSCYERAGYQVRVAARRAEPVRPDRRSPGEPVTPDLTFQQVQVQDYSAITFVGGNGAWHDFFPDAEAHRVLRESLRQDKPTGLICAATGLLALVDNWDGNGHPPSEGRRLVGYFRVAGILKQLGRAQLIEGPVQEPAVEVDGHLVTGRNPESSQLFGEAMVQMLEKEKGSAP